MLLPAPDCSLEQKPTKQLPLPSWRKRGDGHFSKSCRVDPQVQSKENSRSHSVMALRKPRGHSTHPAHGWLPATGFVPSSSKAASKASDEPAKTSARQGPGT